MMTGPDILQRYNMFRTAEINGANGPGISTGQALTVMEDLAAKELSSGLRLRVDQHRLPGKGSGRFARPDLRHGHDLRIPGPGRAIRKLGGALLGAAGLPIGVLGAFFGVSLAGLENNVYVQIGIVR